MPTWVCHAMWRHLIYEEIMHIWEVLAGADEDYNERVCGLYMAQSAG